VNTDTRAAPAPTLREAIAGMSGTVDRLNELSGAGHRRRNLAVGWPEELDAERGWFLPPELSSLHGTRYWDRLDGPAARRLAFHEAANLLSVTVHATDTLRDGLAGRLYRADLAPVADYLHVFLDDTGRHRARLREFCERYAKVYPSRRVPVPGRADPQVSDLLFFAGSLVAAELADRYAALLAADDRLHPLARSLHAARHADESRHLVFLRAMVRAFRAASAPAWSAATAAEVSAELGRCVTAAWREYYNPDVYADRGFDDPRRVAEVAWRAPAQRAHRRRLSAGFMRFLRSEGFSLDWSAGTAP
jgi:P-aminobenzoate N-oxygenase AurF